jgi:hypothetical protein
MSALPLADAMTACVRINRAGEAESAESIVPAVLDSAVSIHRKIGKCASKTRAAASRNFLVKRIDVSTPMRRVMT